MGVELMKVLINIDRRNTDTDSWLEAMGVVLIDIGIVWY